MSPREKPSILVVEDEAKMRRLVELQLGEEGFAVHAAPDAETGLQLLVREKPDLVVTDLRLPGMSGLEMLPKVRAARPRVPVIMITAYGDEATKRKAAELGAAGLLTKPIDFCSLRGEIDERLQQAA